MCFHCICYNANGVSVMTKQGRRRRRKEKIVGKKRREMDGWKVREKRKESQRIRIWKHGLIKGYMDKWMEDR